jgi:hypothetical protein
MLYWIESIGRASIPNPHLQATRDISALLRLAYPTIKPKGAVTAGGKINITGNASIDGTDKLPYAGLANQWDSLKCASMRGPDLPAVTVPPGANVSGKTSNLTGSPAIYRDPAAADSNTYVRYGTENWNTLTRNATIQLPGGTYGSDIEPTLLNGECGPGNFNWGEPNRGGMGHVAACENYFPIIYFSGNVHLNGNGRGQGILLVNGDLEINGTFDFNGIIIVRDDVKRGTGAALVNGAILARNVNLADGGMFWAGTQNVQYSKCAIESALRGSAILRPVRERSWAQLF